MKRYALARLTTETEEKRIAYNILLNIKKPVLEIIKDMKDTFRPYKDRHQKWRDFLYQPFYGIGNLIAAPFLLIVCPLIFFYEVGKIPFKKQEASFGTLAKLLGVKLLYSGILAIRGATQIAAWPLTLLRMPLRAFLTWKQPAVRIEESKGLQELVNLYQDEEKKQVPVLISTQDPIQAEVVPPQEQRATGKQQEIAKVLMQKFKKAVVRNQDTRIEGASTAYTEAKKNRTTENYAKFIGLFSAAIEKVNNEIPERAQTKASTVTTTKFAV